MVGSDRPNPSPAGTGPRNRRQGTAALLVVAALAAGGLADVGHVVAPGENLFTLARKYLTTPQDIARANHIADPNLIVIGMNLRTPASAGPPAPQPAPATAQGLRLPAPPAQVVTYTVKPGDNLT